MSGNGDYSSNSDSSFRHAIVAKNCIVRKVKDGGSAVRTMLTGTFVQVHSIRQDNVIFCVVHNDMQVDSDQLVCKKSDILIVPENLWGPLFTIDPRARLTLVEDTKLAEAIGNITVGDNVQVLGKDYLEACVGRVIFRNTISKLGVGVFFGIKITNVSSKDHIQVVISNVSLLEPQTKGFPRGCDIVVAVDKIRPININSNREKSILQYDKETSKSAKVQTENGNNSSYKTMLVLHLKEKPNSKKSVNNTNEVNINFIASKKRDIDIPLSIGDEVVHIDGDKPEKGTVKWIGMINNSVKVGVEFENPIGSGTGVVDGIELFKAKYQHAMIMPPEGLIKLSDYMNNSKERNKINNNNNYNNLRSSEFCCDRKHSEDKKLLLKSNSHQCLKHPDRTFHTGTNDTFQKISEEDSQKNKIYKSEHILMDSLMHHNSRSFDSTKPTEKKLSNRRQCNSMDSEVLLPNKESKLLINFQNSTGYTQKTPSQDLYDLTGQNWSKHEQLLNNCSEDRVDRVERIGSFEENNLDGYQNNYDYDKLKDNHNRDTYEYSDHSSSDESPGYYDTPKPIPERCAPGEFGKGSVVELSYKGEPHYGVIRWIGVLSEDRNSHPPRLIAGIEMEEERTGFTDGTFNNKRYFHCNPRKAFFTPLHKCRKDSRFTDENQKQSLPAKINSQTAQEKRNLISFGYQSDVSDYHCNQLVSDECQISFLMAFGQIDCPVVEGTIPPINRKGDLEAICGKNKGIQGHHNSCYLDATLFAMFAFTSVFDSLLYRPPTKQDIPQYSEVQRVLRDEIVNPLRKNLYVRADRVMKLRTLLEKLSSVSGLTCEEKDPEEFLNSLLAQILKAEPFLKLSSGQEAFHYQLFVEKDERLTFPSVQQLFEQSFVTSDIKLKQVPSCLIIQMPRFGKSFKMYPRILPQQVLDVTDIIENSPRQCTVCGKLAEYECKDCFGQNGIGNIGNGLESISFCKICLETAHNHHCRARHNYRLLTVPVEFSELQEHCVIPRLFMELFAVVCIETSHYVAFVKCGSGSEAPWCFFDSMADRKGEQNGYNIPEMVPCPDLPYWLSEEGAKTLNEMRDERQLPEHAKRLLCDAYMCMYQSPDMMMYR